MPLKLYKPREGKSPNYTIRGTYLGVYVNISSRAGKRATAQKVLRQTEHDIERGKFNVNGPTFADAALAYMRAGGERTYIGKLLEYFRDMPISQIDQARIDDAATQLYPRASPATRNRSVYTPVCAVLRRSGTRLDLRRPSGASGRSATVWLWPEQAFALLREAAKLDKEFGALCVVLLYTGMRLSEALDLTWNNVRLDEGFAYVSTTKNDEPRAVFLPPMAVAAMGKLGRGHQMAFRLSKSGHLYSLLRVAAIKAGVDLPERTAFHVFRHTYGTWMRRYGGLDTRGLVGTGAWKDAKSAARYAHTVTTEEAARAAMLPTPKWRSSRWKRGGFKMPHSGVIGKDQ